MFFDIFSELCRRNGVTPNKALVDCEISRTSVAKWKKGAVPNGSTLSKIADYFGVTTDYLLGQEKETVIIPGRLKIIEVNDPNLENIQYRIEAADEDAYKKGVEIFEKAGVLVPAATPEERIFSALKKLDAKRRAAAVERVEELIEKAPAQEGEHQISDEDLKFALWGGTDDIDDDDLEDVRNYAAFVRERKKRQNK